MTNKESETNDWIEKKPGNFRTIEIKNCYNCTHFIGQITGGFCSKNIIAETFDYNEAHNSICDYFEKG